MLPQHVLEGLRTFHDGARSGELICVSGTLSALAQVVQHVVGRLCAGGAYRPAKLVQLPPRDCVEREVDGRTRELAERVFETVEESRVAPAAERSEHGAPSPRPLP